MHLNVVHLAVIASILLSFGSAWAFSFGRPASGGRDQDKKGRGDNLSSVGSLPEDFTAQLRPDVQTSRMMRPFEVGEASSARSQGLTGDPGGGTSLLNTRLSVAQQQQRLRFDSGPSDILGLHYDPDSPLSYRSTNTYVETIGMAGLTKLNEFTAPGWVSLRLPASAAPSSPTLWFDTSYSLTYDAYRGSNAVQDMSGILRLQIPIH
jgi:hypothetical protein